MSWRRGTDVRGASRPVPLTEPHYY